MNIIQLEALNRSLQFPHNYAVKNTSKQSFKTQKSAFTWLVIAKQMRYLTTRPFDYHFNEI
jgi:hypothetical protein